MSQHLATSFRRIPLLLSILVVLFITLLLCLALLRFSGVLAGGSGTDPNGVTSGPLINPDGLSDGSWINPDGLAAGSQMDPNGLACSVIVDPNGGCQQHANGLLAAGVMIDGNG